MCALLDAGLRALRDDSDDGPHAHGAGAAASWHWASRVPQIESLEEWAALLKLGMVVAVRAAPAERHLEGGFWLLHVESVCSAREPGALDL